MKLKELLTPKDNSINEHFSLPLSHLLSHFLPASKSCFYDGVVSSFSTRAIRSFETLWGMMYFSFEFLFNHFQKWFVHTILCARFKIIGLHND
jgi:hypothetical protein